MIEFRWRYVARAARNFDILLARLVIFLMEIVSKMIHAESFECFPDPNFLNVGEPRIFLLVSIFLLGSPDLRIPKNRVFLFFYSV